MRRAGFANHHLWVTPYARDELYAAGTYPTLSDTDPNAAMVAQVFARRCSARVGARSEERCRWINH